VPTIVTKYAPAGTQFS